MTDTRVGLTLALAQIVNSTPALELVKSASILNNAYVMVDPSIVPRLSRVRGMRMRICIYELLRLYTIASSFCDTFASASVCVAVGEMAEGVNEKAIPKLTVDELGQFLSSNFDADVIDSLRANKVSGGIFMKLTEQQIGRMVTAIGDVVELMALQSRVTKMLNPLSEQVSFCHLKF